MLNSRKSLVGTRDILVSSLLKVINNHNGISPKTSAYLSPNPQLYKSEVAYLSQTFSGGRIKAISKIQEWRRNTMEDEEQKR